MMINENDVLLIETGIVQISNCKPVEFELDRNCSTLSDHASFLQEKINQSKGELLGLDLDGPVKLFAIFKHKTAVLNHDVKLNPAVKYTFRFKLAEKIKEEQREGPSLVQALAIESQQTQEKVGAQNLVEEQVEKMANLVEEEANEEEAINERAIKCEAQIADDDEQQPSEFECPSPPPPTDRKALKRRLSEEEEEEKVAKRQKVLEEKEKQKLAQIAEYAALIGVPNVANLMKGNYSQEKLFKLILHGNGITQSLYIQNTQNMNDQGLLKAIVNLLAKANSLENMIEEITVECGKYCFEWPRNKQLKLGWKTSNVAYQYNEASESPPETASDRHLAVYELANRGWRVQVELFYCYKHSFNQFVDKFILRRLPFAMN